MRQLKDRVGLGWRKELAASILLHQKEIDVVEVIIDDYFRASSRELRSLATLSRQIPVIYHGVTLGLASAHTVDKKRVELLARALGAVQAEEWSEHLAFVRAGGVEIGHLAAPPRTEATIEGACRNLRYIRDVVGSMPTLENIATLVDPPGSKMGEPEWVRGILTESRTGHLLDLHNLYSNALNFGFDPETYLRRFPLEVVSTVHLSGGHWIHEPRAFANSQGSQRLLDDHIHDVPCEVFQLLRILGEETTRPLTVIIERDGNYPNFRVLLDQIESAREALALGRRSQKGRPHERALV